MILRTIERLVAIRGGRILFANRCKSTVVRNENTMSLSKNLNITESKAQYLCLKHPFIAKLDDRGINDIIDCICYLGFRKEVLVAQPLLFLLHPITLKFRYQILQECSFKKIEPVHIVTYLSLVKQKTIGELIQSGIIQQYVNLENRLAGYMTQWPTSLTNVIDDDISKYSLYSLRLKIIQRYLELLLDLNEDEFNRGIKTYPTIKHRPLNAINETLKILQTQIMMPPHKIRSNLYLVHVDPENLIDIIRNFKTVGGIDVKEVIRMHPRIATKNCNILIEIRKVLEQYNISNEAQRRCFDIYTLGPNTVRERLEHAKAIPEFSTFYNHPRFLKMIHYNNTAMERLRHLYSNNKKCLSLNILSGSSAHFEVYEKSPGDRLGKSKDLLFCVSQSLGKGYNKSDIRKMLKRHPFWINIPLIQVKYVFDKLTKDFTNKDIYENCPIILYPWNKVKETINILNNQSGVFHDGLDLTRISQSQKLSMALYLLEKKHYFSGNGVWNNEKTKANVDILGINMLKNVHSVQSV
ncbi:transcription termination factor 5, mitochondrial-like [Plodia interpunctella]|uniref:transcription termination factor 5, mitochondrial-like n=1 Tax=Plodia interpunctella TaxID=58824 RepID=UPI002367A8F5|nr:transcription termination factor 5, mitochondrial-like [Plodia interpunctella]